MTAALVLLSFEFVPIGVVLSAARDDSLQRRTRFWLRLVGVLLCMTAPLLVLAVCSAFRWIGPETEISLLWCGVVWALLLIVLSPVLLFHGPGSDPGSDDDGGGGGPGPGHDPPSPPDPHGGLPLPDAEQSARRLRGPHREPRVPRPRRPVREPEPQPTRVRPFVTPHGARYLHG